MVQLGPPFCLGNILLLNIDVDVYSEAWELTRKFW